MFTAAACLVPREAAARYLRESVCEGARLITTSVRMCSVDPDGVVEMTQATETLDISRGDVMCRKCASAMAEVVLRVRDAYCRNCFLVYFTHKFRSTIGKSKQIHPGDRILVGLSEKDFKKTHTRNCVLILFFLYVDECVLCTAVDEGCEHVHKVIEQVTSMGFPCYIAMLEQVMALQPQLPVLRTQEWKEMKHTVDENLRKKFCELFSSCKSASAQQDLHDQLLQTVLKQCAYSLGFRKMFLGDNSTTLSVRILSQVALGRGSQLPARVHFKATSQSVEVYRPMRELLENEIIDYLNLQNITVPRPPTFQPNCTSIASCTEKFVRNIQARGLRKSYNKMLFLFKNVAKILVVECVIVPEVEEVVAKQK
ncbi:hypothetical protein O3P69_007982 [Scylla paramamosain]|uniref:Cytoplasmic tRNA 2-thiolation protein 2 n=1 Tax=Scylla paramamosain TaxID=85552 RepID=A0AAW0SZI4_SCYPA